MKQKGKYILTGLFSIVLASGALYLLSSTSEVTQTEVEVEKKVIDIGKIRWDGKEAKALFKIKNVGDENMSIKNITADCHCTVPNWNKGETPPNTSTQIEVIYDKHSIGFFQQVIKVELNSPKSPILLVMRGKIIE